MSEPTMKQIAAELLAAQEQAMAIVVAAMCKQLDAERLATDLRAQLFAAKQTGSASSVAMRLATHALAAAEAETKLRNPPTH
jgi:hypothetical protein